MRMSIVGQCDILQLWNSSRIPYDAIADVAETKVQWSSHFQCGSRLLKKSVMNLFLCISMAYNVISCQKVDESTQILKIAKFAL